METKYTDLNAMLHSDTEARQYFSSLPEYLQDHISSRAESINTLSHLRAYGHKLPRRNV